MNPSQGRQSATEISHDQSHASVVFFIGSAMDLRKPTAGRDRSEESTIPLERLDGGIVTEAGRQSVGRWTTWNDHWTNLYPKGGNGRCGCVSELRPEHVANAAQRLGLRVGWTVDLKVWRREKSYGELKAFRRSIHFFDEGEIVH